MAAGWPIVVGLEDTPLAFSSVLVVLLLILKEFVYGIVCVCVMITIIVMVNRVTVIVTTVTMTMIKNIYILC